MKKLSDRHHQLLVRKARAGNSSKARRPIPAPKRESSFQPFTVEVWDGSNVEQALCELPPELPPSVLCFEKNLDKTLRFLNKLRSRVIEIPAQKPGPTNWLLRPKGKMPRIKSYIDFGEIEELETAPALVMAAVYDRGKHASGHAPPAVNFPNWSQQAFQTLYEIGFFEVIGHAPAERIKEVYGEKLDSSYKVSKTLTGKNADELEEASDVISELLDYLSVDTDVAEDLIPEINSAVSEAMINVARHAYPDSFVAASSALCLRRWWMSARADKETNKLTIVVYDQGATIPGTLPRREWYQETIAEVMRAIIPDFDYESAQRRIDHEYIVYSMKKGKTQTGDAERGLGLPQMQDLIETCPDGTLSILSRGGLYRYGKGVGVHKRRLQTEIEGTLIEWELTLPKGKQDGE